MRLLAVSLALLATVGCFSTFKVQKVPIPENKANTVPGLRYSLPAAFVVVEPDTAKPGSYTVETRLFPDPTQTYAIDASTYLATTTLTVDLAQGMLSKVLINQDAGSLGSEVVEAVSEVVEKDLAQREKEKEEAEKEAEKQAEKRATLEKAVEDAEDGLQVARSAVNEWQVLVSLDRSNATYQLGLRQAKENLAKAELALQRANGALNAFFANAGAGAVSVGGVTDGPGGGGGATSSPAPAADDANTGAATVSVEGVTDGPGGGGGATSSPTPAADDANTDAATVSVEGVTDGPGGGGGATSSPTPAAEDGPVRKGPLLYRLVDTCDVWKGSAGLADCKVELVPVHWKGKPTMTQLDFPVRKLKKPPAGDPVQPELADAQVTPEPIVFDDGVARRNLVLTAPICAIDPTQSVLRPVDESGDEGDRTPVSKTKLGLTLAAGKGTVELAIPESALDPGRYALTIDFSWLDCKPPGETRSGDVDYEFRIPE